MDIEEEDDDILEQKTIDSVVVSENMKSDTKEKVVRALAKVEDPELGIDLVNLGLIYEIQMQDNGDTTIIMTLTAMGCPLAGTIVDLVKNALQDVPEIGEVDVNVVWNPPWNKERVSRIARLAMRI